MKMKWLCIYLERSLICKKIGYPKWPYSSAPYSPKVLSHLDLVISRENVLGPHMVLI